MSFKKELHEDIGSAVEAVLERTMRSYEFVGRGHKSLVAVNGFGFGWRKKGLRSLMERYDLSGELLNWNLFKYRIDHYISRFDHVVQKYKRPLLMGFSSGGYILLLWASRGNKWDEIEGIITVATLFHGNPRLSKHLGGVLRETVPEAPILNEVLAINPPSGKVVSLLPSEDKFGTLPESIKLNWQTIKTDARSHGDIQNHMKWYENIVREKLSLDDLPKIPED